MSPLEIFYTVIVVVALFSLTIFVHELGHFLVARWCGMVIETFSIGFGPALWQWKRKGITYKIGALPLGGYVALPQMDPNLGDDDKHAGEKKDALAPPPPPAAPWKRIAVAFAGAGMNLVLAFLIAAIFYVNAEHRSPTAERATVGFVSPQSKAASAGLAVGDHIRTINGNAVASWDDVIVNAALSDRVRLEVVGRDGVPRTLEVETENVPGGRERHLKGVDKSSACLVIGIVAGAPAEAAGVKRGDVIQSIAGEPVFGNEDLIARIGKHADTMIPLVVLRKKQEVTLQVRPIYDETQKRVIIGIHFNQFDYTRPPLAQVWAWASPVFRVFQALGSREERPKAVAAISGPVGIFKIYWMAASTSFLLALWLTGLINVNLAIMNLLPLPVLDGGHIVFALYEGIFRRPPHATVVGWAHRIFAVLLITLILLLTGRDVRDLFRKPFHKTEPAGISATLPDAPPHAAPAKAEAPAAP